MIDGEKGFDVPNRAVLGHTLLSARFRIRGKPLRRRFSSQGI
jgi:hypothetical protein